jgi:hypothetical protein
MLGESKKEGFNKLFFFSVNLAASVGLYSFLFGGNSRAGNEFCQLFKDRKFHDQKQSCASCGKKVSQRKELQGHHCIPVWRGGTNSYCNLALLCFDCHPIWDAKAENGAFFYPETKQGCDISVFSPEFFRPEALPNVLR